MSDWLRHFQRKAEAASDEKPQVTQDTPSTITRPLGLVHPASCASFVEEGNKNIGTPDGTSSLGSGGDDYFKDLSPATPPANSTGDSWSYPKDIDDIWHRPTLEQISDTLFVVMMNKPHHQPIPVEYDTWVRQLVKGCADLSRTLRATEQLLAEEKETKERSMDAFTQMSMDWEEREAAYKAEIRRMEVLLARSAPSGVEAVLVARSGSIVDRSIAGAKRFRASLQKARGVISATTSNTSGPSQDTQDTSSFQKFDEADKRNNQQHKVLQRSFNQESGAVCNQSLPGSNSANAHSSGPDAPIRAALGQAKAEAAEGFHNDDQPTPGQTINRECRSHTAPSMIHHAAGHEPIHNQADEVASQSPRVTRRPHQAARHGRTFSFNPGVEKLSLPNIRIHVDNSQDAPIIS